MEETCRSILFVCKTVLSVNTQGAFMRLDLYGNVMIICNSLDKRNIMIAKVLILFDKSSETGCFFTKPPQNKRISGNICKDYHNRCYAKYRCQYSVIYSVFANYQIIEHYYFSYQEKYRNIWKPV